MLSASALLLVGLIVGFAVYWTSANERQMAAPRLDDTPLGRMDAAQADVQGVKSSSPAMARCCEVRGKTEGTNPLAMDASATTHDPEEKTGLPIGRTAPAFTLTDQNGNEVSLESLLKKGPVAVVFHRSVSWCLYCKLQMVQLQRIHKEIEDAGGQVVGISYDSVEKLKGYADRSKITFPLLSDVGSKTIDAYDIRYKEAPPETSGFARHATFVIDQKGIIRAKLFRISYQERPVVDLLINALKEARR
jgi:peroxiredoxin